MGTFLSYLSYDVVCDSYFSSCDAHVNYTALRIYPDLLSVMSFLLVHHLPRLVALERRKTVSDRHSENLYIDIALMSVPLHIL